MSLDSRHDILNDIPVLLLQGSNRGQDSFGKAGGCLCQKSQKYWRVSTKDIRGYHG
jgi:hypothetical protein